MFSAPANRWQAFGLHLLISLVIFIALAALICFWWYPGFMFRYDGGLEGIKLIAGVDFVIGPLLTLLVYKVGKKSLRFDLACIAVLQLACLAGGMWAIEKTRPVAVVYAAGTFSTVNRHAYEVAGFDIAKIEAFRQPWPMWRTVDLPQDSGHAIGATWLLMGENIHTNIENYADYSAALPSLAKDGLMAKDIKDAKADLDDLQTRYPSLRFFPVTTSMYSGYLAVDITTGEVARFIEQL